MSIREVQKNSTFKYKTSLFTNRVGFAIFCNPKVISLGTSLVKIKNT